MKRSMTEIAYISGLLERRGHLCNLRTADRGIELEFADRGIAEHVASLIGGKILKKPNGNRVKYNFIYISCTQAIGWFMTCWKLVSPPTRERFEHAIISWKSRQRRGVKNHPAPCHPNRPYHARNKCAMCYRRERRGTLYVNYREKN